MGRVLLIGSGAREHALARVLAHSPEVSRIFCYPGNGGISEIAECPNLGVPVTDTRALLRFAVENQIHLTVVGPEAPLVAGIADRFKVAGKLLLGPTWAASQLEGSKVFAKEFMRRYGIPTADFRVFDDPAAARSYVLDRNCPLVVKANGLAGGKGVYVYETAEEAVRAIEDLMVGRVHGDAGERIVIEERLLGKECSFLTLVNGVEVVEFGTAVDYKRAYDGDQGPNTGGMGCYSPCPAVANDSVLKAEIMSRIVMPTVYGMSAEGFPYRGFLYVGLMLTGDGPKVLEYNIRLGDPEAQVILPQLEVDAYDLFTDAASNKLGGWEIFWRGGVTVGVVLTSHNYPGKDSIHKRITGPIKNGELGPGLEIFHAATVREGDKVFATGGRILTVVGSGEFYYDARKRAYDTVSKIKFEGMRYRSDIAAHP